MPEPSLFDEPRTPAWCFVCLKTTVSPIVCSKECLQ